ncbi:unnamed protein product [Rhizoctonia solani]|uniref:Uncharacterized protein n=1 Tax=Rhizoctonia solani TaxID=456999 RepID=A0A8H2XWN4_9AGAM|nr:unnamed protein product [Rhizoctonia solani]
MYLELISIQTMSFVVATRVYDLWGNNRTALFVLSPLWTAHCVADFAMVTKHAIRQAPRFRHEEVFNICFVDVSGSWVVWLNRVIYETIILLILIWLWMSTPRSSQTPFMKIVLRDGFIYFFTIFTAMLFRLVVWKHGRRSLAALPCWSVWAFTTQALLRMLLSMGSVQTSEEWGQRAKIQLPSIEVELGALRGPDVVSRVTFFSDVESTHDAMPQIKFSTMGKFED